MASSRGVRRCPENIRSGVKPVLVNFGDKEPTAEGLADDTGLADRIDIFGQNSSWP